MFLTPSWRRAASQPSSPIGGKAAAAVHAPAQPQRSYACEAASDPIAPPMNIVVM